MPTRLLHQYVDEAALVRPEKQALTDGRDTLSYGELSNLSNKLARCLISNGLERGGHVIVSMSRSVRVIVAMMGVLKASAAYVPVPADLPTQRRQKILRNCRPHAFIGDANSIRGLLAEGLSHELPAVLLCLDHGS